MNHPFTLSPNTSVASEMPRETIATIAVVVIAGGCYQRPVIANIARQWYSRVMAKKAAKRYSPVNVRKVSVWMTPSLLERSRAAVSALHHEIPNFSFVRLLEQSLTREIDRLERRHNGGKRFPAAVGELKRGARARS